MPFFSMQIAVDLFLDLIKLGTLVHKEFLPVYRNNYFFNFLCQQCTNFTVQHFPIVHIYIPHSSHISRYDYLSFFIRLCNLKNLFLFYGPLCKGYCPL